MPDRAAAERILNRRAAAPEIVAQSRRAEAKLQAVPVPVQADEVTRGGDFGHQRRTPADLLADDEERGPGLRARQYLEDRRGALGVGAVVEGQGYPGRMGAVVDGHPGGYGQDTSEAQPGGSGRPDRSQSMRDHAAMIPNRRGGAVSGRTGPVKPDLDAWVPDAGLRVDYARESTVSPSRLWRAARELSLTDTGLLGRLVRWRIPGLAPEVTIDELFREPPFLALAEAEHFLVSGLVGRIWTLRRDYPRLRDPNEFRDWDLRGTVRVVFAHWVEPGPRGAVLSTQVRVQPLGNRGRVGLAAVRPIVRRFGSLVGSEGLAAAVRAAERET